MATQRTVPSPQPHPDTEAFWAAASEGRFLIRTCSSCGKAHWYPRPLCPFCRSPHTHWTSASGRGKIYTFSVMRRTETPYAIGYVTLAEGPTLLTNFVDCEFDHLAIGQDVKVVFVASAGGPMVPMFRPL